MIKLTENPDGKLRLEATLTHPIVYLDHWAIIEFSKDQEKQKQFLSILKDKKGTLLLSQGNFFEASGFDDIQQAKRIESFLELALPNIHIVDFSLDTHIFGLPAQPSDNTLKDKFWMIQFLLELAKANGKKLTVRTMFTEAINHKTLLKPLFLELKEDVRKAIQHAIHSEEMLEKASKYRPSRDQSPSTLLISAYLNDAQQNRAQNFTENDSMDFIHAVPSILVSDFVLLDKAWCNRTMRAESYLISNGINLKLARRYWGNTEQLAQFFTDLSSFTYT